MRNGSSTVPLLASYLGGIQNYTPRESVVFGHYHLSLFLVHERIAGAGSRVTGLGPRLHPWHNFWSLGTPDHRL